MDRLLDGKYELGRLLGQGGMGQVFEAEQVSIHRRVAVKILHPALAMDVDAVRRFQREAETLAALDHPHLVRLHDFGSSPDGQVYLVMELLEGEDLMMVLERAGPAPFERIAPILVDVLEALETCHDRGFIHRDLKPSNVFLARTPEGVVTKVLDFGVVRAVSREETALTVTGGFVGTATYMAPEQARGEDIDTRADLYSIGAILYHALSGVAPYEANTFQGILARVLTEEPPPLRTRRPDLDIPEVAERLCSWAMARDREKRPENAAALRRALEAAMTGRRSIPLLPRGAKPAPERSPRPLLWAIGVVLLVGVLVAGAFGIAALSGGGSGPSTTVAATVAPATGAGTTAAPASALPLTVVPPPPIPQVEIRPTAPLTSSPLPTPTGEVEITPLGPLDDADLAAALGRPGCEQARSIEALVGGEDAARALALAVAATSRAACGSCEAFAREAIRREPGWDLPHFQLALCLARRDNAAEACQIVDEIQTFTRLARRRQRESPYRAPYQQAAPEFLRAYRPVCRANR